MSYFRRKFIIKVVITVFMTGLSIAMLLPFVWMLSASFKFDSDVFNVPVDWFPRNPTISNYIKIWSSSVPFHKFLMNSVKIAVICVSGELITSALAAYAFAKMKFFGRNVMFWLYVATLIFPVQMMLIPRFVLFRQMGLYNTHWALILPGIFTAFGTFMLRQFFYTVPDELSEAAKIDGAGHFMVFWRIVIPLSTAALSALVIFQFVGIWNDYESPLIFLRSMELATVPLGLQYFTDENSASYGSIMAASVISLLPIFIIFLSFQKQFVAGIATSGMKE